MNQRERDDLDRHITGNYGEDQFRPARRRYGSKAPEAFRLAKASIMAERRGDVPTADARYQDLCRLVGVGNAAYWMMEAEGHQ